MLEWKWNKKPDVKRKKGKEKGREGGIVVYLGNGLHISEIEWIIISKIQWRGELVQGTLYTSMELSQWSPLILFMYANSKIKLKKTICTNLNIMYKKELKNNRV
jgi:hypothetical protein